MAKIDATKIWSLNYRLIMTILIDVSPQISELGVETKELFVLGQIDEYPHPAELAMALCMPKPTVTVNLKRLEAAGLVRREIDEKDLRRHRLSLTPAGRKVMTRGLTILSDAFGARLSKLSTAELGTFKTLLEKLT